MPRVIPSVAVPRRQAEMTPVSVPRMIAKSVPSSTIGIVFFSAVVRLDETGCWFANEIPRFPCASCFR